MPRTPLLCSLTILLVGCAGWQNHLAPNSKTDGPSREDRAAEAIREFEERRDVAQYQAALDRCRQGDLARAEQLLSSLVARKPEFFDARLRLAELLSARGEAAAEVHFQAVLTGQPTNAEAHHAYGLFLNALGRVQEAHEHLAQAAELDPQNEIFKTTLAAFQ